LLTYGPHRHVIIFFKAGGERTSRTTSAFFSFFAIPLDLIPDDLRHHLTSRLILLKPHSPLRNIPQTTHTESPQAARNRARTAAETEQLRWWFRPTPNRPWPLSSANLFIYFLRISETWFCEFWCTRALPPSSTTTSVRGRNIGELFREQHITSTSATAPTQPYESPDLIGIVPWPQFVVESRERDLPAPWPHLF
jgi:hypothetical protein